MKNINIFPWFVHLRKKPWICFRYWYDVLPSLDLLSKIKTLKKNLYEHGEECFETCSHTQIHSISECVKSFLDSDARNKIRNFNPDKYDLIRQLMDPYIKSVKKIGNSDITIHEKRKTLQKTNVGETVIHLITNVILPYLKQLKWIFI